MKAAMAGKIALCVCPPVLVATSVATVPPVRRTVHRLTAPHHPHPVPHHRHRVAAAAPCLPAGAGPGALRTFASPGPADDGFASPSSAPGSGPSFGLPSLADLPGPTGDYRSPSTPVTSTPGGILPPGTDITTPPTTGTPTPTPTPTDNTPAVPEPLTWLLMLAGVGVVGSALRQLRGPSPAGRRVAIARAGLAADLLATPLDVVGSAAKATVSSSGQAVGSAATGAKSTGAALLAKAALCVCPPALLATSVATVPPVRHAVYAATAPHGLRPAAAAPCDPGITIVDPHAPAGSTATAPGAAPLSDTSAVPAAPAAAGPAAPVSDTSAVPVAPAASVPAGTGKA